MLVYMLYGRTVADPALNLKLCVLIFAVNTLIYCHAVLCMQCLRATGMCVFVKRHF